MIDQQTINRIMDTARIEDVVGEFVSLKKRGQNYIGLCPFHDERTPSFSVSPTRGICKCFSCGKGGNVVHFIMEHEHMGYYEALKWLAKRYGIEVVEKELTDEEKRNRDERESMYVINEMARDYFRHCMNDTAEGRSVGQAYFRQRGIREDIIEKFQLGYCSSSRDAFSMNAIQKGYDSNLLVKTGLSIADNQGHLFDRYRERVIFPVLSVSGKVVAFGGRILKKAEKLAKYVNSPESIIYHKSDELYGIFQAKQAIVRQDRCYLVEGYVDVLSMHQSGICNVVASSGTSLTHGQIRLIHRFTSNVTVLYDGDAAGIKASLRSINMLLEEGLNIKVVLLPDGEDPDSYAQSHSSTEFMDYIKSQETDFIRFKARILLKDCGDDPISRSNVIKELVESIAVIPDEIIRSEYIKECAAQLNTREEMLVKEVSKARYQAAERKRQQRQIDARRAEAANAAGTPAPLKQPSTIGDSDEMPFPDIAYMPPEADTPMPDVTGFTPAPPLQSSSRPSTVLAGPSVKPAANPFEPYERNLMRIIVRYGHRLISEGVTVINYIKEDLQADEIEFTVPMFRQMFHEAVEHASDEGFESSKLFLHHQDPAVSLLAADMVSDKYELSKIYKLQDRVNDVKVFQRKIETEEESLPTLVPHLLEDLKYKILKEEIRKISEEMKAASKGNNPTRLQELMVQYKDLHDLEQEFSKQLGERIIG